MKKLINTLFLFSHQMFLKLMKKHGQGFTGWDGMSEQTLLENMRIKLNQIECGQREEIDLADYAMFLWHRRELKK